MNEKNLSSEIIVVSDKKNAIEYKAMAFVSEQTKTTFNYEIKRVRALWDPTLSIPGTGRRGGWRCPVGTRYGGQITDRFGRNCGWGVARRLANAITSIGDRLENRDDERRNRRVERRNARMIARLQQDERGGALERGARNIAERLEGGVAPTQTQRGEGRLQRIFGDDGPLRVGPARMPREIQDRQPRRQPQQRRPVQREIEQPTTPQNEEQTPAVPATPAAPERPVRPTPARRRRGQAQTDAVAPEDAPMPNESFDDYTNRKYEEYKSRIEKIQQEGGNAGLLTRDEWFKFNEGNLREAHNRVNNVPDAERPAPRPRKPAPRRRRVNASDARAQESANRRPRAEDRPVPEVPQPKPSRRVDETPRPLEIEADPDFGAEPDLGGSLPDVRSVRNVRNRFRERGLPDTAYWRADDYAGDDKAELERRFGRYFDANNQRNARGDFVNNRIQEGDGQPAPRKQPPASPRQPGNSDNAARSEELRQNREAMAQAAIEDARQRVDDTEIEDARQRADDAENALNAPIPSDEVERQRQIAELRKLALEVQSSLEQMQRVGVRAERVRQGQRRLDALLNRITQLQDTRTRDLDGAIITQGQGDFELKPPPANGNPQDNPFDARESKEMFERLNYINTWIKKARKYLDGEGPAPRNFEQMQGNAPGVSEQRTRAELRSLIQERDQIKESLRKRGYADAEQARLDFNRFIKQRRAQRTQPSQSPRPAAPQQPNNRPQPQIDVREPDPSLERILDEEAEVAARVGGNSDDAANSERLRRAREFAANRPGRVQDFNSIVGNPLFVGYIADAIRGNGNRLAIVNNPENFPNSPAEKRQVAQAARQNIATFTRWREDLQRAENRGVIGENDFIEVDGEQVKLARIKTTLTNNIDAWGEVLAANEPSSSAPANAPRRPRQPRRQGAVRSRRNAQSSQNNEQQPAPRQVSKMNRLQSRHDAKNLPRLANGKFNKVLTGNKGIETELDAASYAGPLTDIPDNFLGVALRKRSKTLAEAGAEFAGQNPNAAASREAREFKSRVEAARKTGGASLTDSDRQKLLQLKREGFPYVSYAAGSGGANPYFHLYIGDDGSIDGRGYLFKPPDRSFGVASQHSELFGALLAERMGFAAGQGRIVEDGGVVKLLQELGPNFAEGHVKNVDDFTNGAGAVTDKESRLGMALVNAITGAVDRHSRNGMVFEGNGALPIDFGRAFYKKTDTVNSLLSYMIGPNSDYGGIDMKPFDGYKNRITELQNAGSSRAEAIASVRAELKTTLSTWANGMRSAYDDGTVAALDRRFASRAMQGRGTYGQQTTPVPERAAKVLSRIALIESDEFVDKIMAKITPPVRP